MGGKKKRVRIRARIIFYLDSRGPSTSEEIAGKKYTTMEVAANASAMKEVKVHSVLSNKYGGKRTVWTLKSKKKSGSTRKKRK